MADPLIHLLRQAVDHIDSTVAAVTPDTVALPTACPDMNAGAVAAHLITGLTGFADVAGGAELRFDEEPAPSGRDVVADYREAAHRMLDAFDSDALDRTFSLPWGDCPGRQLVGFSLIEVLTHGWDLGRALGRDARLPSDAAIATLDLARQWIDESVRVPGMFGAEVPVSTDADVTDRLVAFLGRDPHWMPPG